MKCLSIRQPWADFIVAGGRRLEILSWSTTYRGELLIHVPSQIDREACDDFGIVSPLLTGVIIGVVELEKVWVLNAEEWHALRLLHLEFGERPYGERTYGWFLKNPERFPAPVPFRGRLGLFNFPDERLPPRFGILKGGKIIESFIAGRYTGHRREKIFGRLDCRTGNGMKKKNRVFFHSWEDAISEGYRPCRVCKPSPMEI